MPFAYFGAKHRFARYYPPPAYKRIIEPFAGSAGYSVYWATPQHEVTLIDSDPLVISMWEALRDKPTETLEAAEAEMAGEYTDNPFIYSIAGGLTRVKPGGTAKISAMMRHMWPGIRRRIEGAVPMIAKWDIVLGDYREFWYPPAATIFVDAPYQPTKPGVAADRYGEKKIDYTDLANWCRLRSSQNQMIVCEQAPADWLAFQPLVTHETRMRADDRQPRTEVMWTNQPEPEDAESQRQAASKRRWARMKPREDKWRPKHLR